MSLKLALTGQLILADSDTGVTDFTIPVTPSFESVTESIGRVQLRVAENLQAATVLPSAGIVTAKMVWLRSDKVLSIGVNQTTTSNIAGVRELMIKGDITQLKVWTGASGTGDHKIEAVAVSAE